MTRTYRKEIKPLKEDVIGHSVTGEAELIEEENILKVKFVAKNTPANMMHWSHFHGFTYRRKGRIPTKDADSSGKV